MTATLHPEKKAGPVIAAFLGHQTLGNFVMYNLVAASIARSIPGSRLVVLYREDRPYKELVVRCNPHVAHRIKVPADTRAVIPIDWLSGQGNSPFGPTEKAAGLDRPDLFLVPSMIDISACQQPVPGLRVPDTLTPILARSLEMRGIVRDRWITCIHMREDSYRFRPSRGSRRSVDPSTYLPVIEHIIRNQGGQVVRLGDPNNTPLPDMESLIDLSQDETSFPEQLFALSRARYYLGTDSGPTQLATGFKIPTASTNSMGIAVWNDGDVILTKTFIGPDGKPVPYREVFEAGTLSVHREVPDFWSVGDNTSDQLIAVADHMLQATDGCEGWRQDAPHVAEDHPNTLSFPLPWRDVTELGNLTIWE